MMLQTQMETAAVSTLRVLSRDMAQRGHEARTVGDVVCESAFGIVEAAISHALDVLAGDREAVVTDGKAAIDAAPAATRSVPVIEFGAGPAELLGEPMAMTVDGTDGAASLVTGADDETIKRAVQALIAQHYPGRCVSVRIDGTDGAAVLLGSDSNRPVATFTVGKGEIPRP